MVYGTTCYGTVIRGVWERNGLVIGVEVQNHPVRGTADEFSVGQFVYRVRRVTGRVQERAWCQAHDRFECGKKAWSKGELGGRLRGEMVCAGGRLQLNTVPD